MPKFSQQSWERLSKYVVTRAVDRKLAMLALTRVKPLVDDALAGRYPLAARLGFRELRITEAISRAIGGGVSRIEPLSATDLAPDRSLLSYAAYDDDLARAFLRRHGEDVLDRLGEERRNEFLETLFIDSLGDTVMRNVVEGRREFFAAIKDDRRLCNLIAAGPMIPVFYLLAYAMLGDAPKMAELTPLVGELQRCIPIGEPKSSPCNWVVLIG